MGESCCTLREDQAPSFSAACPECGHSGRSVAFETVAALTRVRLPKRQAFRLCREEACSTVYWGSEGARLAVADLTVTPGFKNPGGKSLVCYCFLYDTADIERELAEQGDTTVPDRIRHEIEQGNCACEVRNPGGRCCLGDVNRAVRLSRTAIEGVVS